MLNRDIIKEVIAQRDMIPFPEQFKKLRDAGNVLHYEVDLKNKTNTYVANGEKFVEKFENVTFNVSDNFDESQIKVALDRRRNKKTTFFEFLAELAQAGVTKYRVDMIKNTVGYQSNTHAYTENIPLSLIT